jgi:nicotinamidase-related amidase
MNPINGDSIMLVKQMDSLVLLIDMQEKLAPVIEQGKEVEQAAAWVLQIAVQLGVPILATEQYPQGLGVTLPALAELVPADHVMEKIHFSALREPLIAERLKLSGKTQLVIIGTETHVCVLQTAMDALAAGYQVFIVEEAVGSRTEQNRQLALLRLQQAGAQIISKEMLAFEWLDKAGTDNFRTISKGWIR